MDVLGSILVWIAWFIGVIVVVQVLMVSYLLLIHWVLMLGRWVYPWFDDVIYAIRRFLFGW